MAGLQASLPGERVLERRSIWPASFRPAIATGALESIGVGLGFSFVVVLFASLAPYGLELSDEGYILFPAYQVSQGFVPYRDIVSLYTPMTWYLHGAVFKVFGLDLLPIRYLFTIAKACTIILTYLLARRLMGPGFAMLPGMILLLLDPAPRHWAPYPAYYGLAGALAALLATSRFLSSGRVTWLLAAGLACAFVFAAKPSIGLFAIAAVSAFLVYNAPHLDTARAVNRRAVSPSPLLPVSASPFTRLLPGLVLAASVAAASLVLWRHLDLGVASLYVLPVAAAGLLHVLTAHRAPHGDKLFAPLVRWFAFLWGGFLGATVPWLVALGAVAGGAVPLRYIFREGVATAEAFYAPLLPPNRDTLDLLIWTLAGCLIALLVSRGVGRGRRRLDARLAYLLAAGLAIGLGFLWYRAQVVGLDLGQYLLSNLEGRFWRQITEETDTVMYAPLLGLWLALGWLAARATRSAAIDSRELHVRLLVLFGAIFLMQLYPKASNQHVLFTVAPYLVLAAFILSEVYRACVAQWGERRPGPLGRAAVLLCLLVFPLSFATPALRVKAAVLSLSVVEPQTQLGRLSITYDVARSLDRVTEYVQTHTRSDEPIFIYPASPMFYLSTQRPNPTRFSYLPSGYIGPEDQAQIISVLSEQQVRYVIWDQQLVDRWGLKPIDRPLADFLWSHFRPVESVRTYVILERVKH